MESFSFTKFDGLKTLQQRAEYLLKFPIETELDIENLEPVSVAKIGKIRLPISGKDSESVKAKAKQWLEKKAAQED